MNRLRALFRKKKVNGTSSIGATLVNLGFITRVQLHDALQVRAGASNEELLGEVLIARGYITRSQWDRVVLIQREQRGERVDYAEEARKLIASAGEQTMRLHTALDEIQTRVVRLTRPATASAAPTPLPRGEKA